jgi:hypothetical protein
MFMVFVCAVQKGFDNVVAARRRSLLPAAIYAAALVGLKPLHRSSARVYFNVLMANRAAAAARRSRKTLPFSTFLYFYRPRRGS